MIFTVDKRLFDLFPGLAVGVLVCHIDNFRYGDDRLESILDRIRSGFSYEKPQDHPHIKAWRLAFGKVGLSPAKYQSSIESLLRRALKGGPFPRVNPIVDLYNAMSLEYLVPIGGHDLTPLDGSLFLGFAEGGEPFTPMDGGEPETAEKGEVVYKDDKDVLTRRWVWRQSNKDKVTPQTKSIFIPDRHHGGYRPLPLRPNHGEDHCPVYTTRQRSGHSPGCRYGNPPDHRVSHRLRTSNTNSPSSI